MPPPRKKYSVKKRRIQKKGREGKNWKARRGYSSLCRFSERGREVSLWWVGKWRFRDLKKEKWKKRERRVKGSATRRIMGLYRPQYFFGHVKAPQRQTGRGGKEKRGGDCSERKLAADGGRMNRRPGSWIREPREVHDEGSERTMKKKKEKSRYDVQLGRRGIIRQ